MKVVLLLKTRRDELGTITLSELIQITKMITLFPCQHVTKKLNYEVEKILIFNELVM